MKLQSLLTGILLLAGGSVAQAVPYTYVYDLFQGGYDDGGTLSSIIRITDVDADGMISAADTFTGTLLFRRSSPLYQRSFDITEITGSVLSFGSFSIVGLSPIGGAATITNSGGTVVNYEFPVTGQYTVASTNQAPVMKWRVDDGGSSLLMLGLGLFSCRWIKSRQSKACRL